MSDDATSTDTDDTSATEDDEAQQLLADTTGADQLGDAGKKALDRMKQQVKQSKAELSQFKGLGLSPEQIREMIDKSATDKAQAEAARTRQEAEQAALSKANERLIRAEVKAAATGKLANPELALRLLDMSDIDVNDDGEVDTAAIATKIDELIQKEPYLGVTQGDGKRFQGTGDTGPKGEPAGKPQLTEAEVKQLYNDKKYAEIDKAQREGRLNTVLGITA